MPKKPEHLYEYAVIRYLPCVEREEFINIGLIMMCKRQRWIKVATRLDLNKINAYDCKIPIEQIERQLDSFVAIADGDRTHGEIATLPVEERFRWLTAVRSACLQTSRPHPGLTDNLDLTFETIYRQMV